MSGIGRASILIGAGTVVSRLSGFVRTVALVAVLSSVGCCGYAGDKGLFVPELNEWATRFAKSDIPPDCRLGVSTVSTCAAGLSERTGIPFISLVSLLEAVSRE